MAREYEAPIEGIQSARSTNWKSFALSKLRTSQRHGRQHSSDQALAQSLIAFGFEDGISNRTSRPASGAKSTIDKM